MRPALSILLPFKNAGSTLAQCISSIQAQSLQDFEVIAVDDHSADNSAEIWQQSNDPRFRLVTSNGNGLIDALNFGLSKSDTQWIVRMDADDIMHPQRLARQLDYLLQHPQTDLLACRVRLFSESTIKAGYSEYIRWQNTLTNHHSIINQRYVESPFAHPSVVFNRQRVINLGGYRKGDFPEDYELWLRMALAGCRFHKLEDTLLDWRDSASRLSRTASIYRREAFDQLRADYLALDSAHFRERPLAIWGAGRKTRKRAQRFLDKGFKVTAWIDIDPAKTGNFLKGVAVVFPHWLSTQVEKPFVLIYVTNHGARDLIAEELEQMGYKIGEDYLAVG